MSDEPGLFRIRTARLADGERLPILVDRAGIPVPLPNQYALLYLRPVLQAPSMAARLRHIAHLYDWATRRSIDLADRVLSGNGLTPNELRTLYSYLAYQVPFGRRSARSAVVEVDRQSFVQGRVQAVRVAAVRDYLVWAIERTLYSYDVGSAIIAEIRDRRDRIIRLSAGFKQSKRPASKGGMEPAARDRLLEIVHPSFAHNPFQRRVRFRNWIIVLLLVTFGYRRGEILKLRVDRIRLNSRTPTIILTRMPDDPEDPRTEMPSVKTFGRELPIEPFAALALQRFIAEHRPQFPGADASPFLLLSCEGNPLCIRQLNEMFEQIRRRFPEFDSDLAPHRLRHTFNDMLALAAANAGLNESQRKEATNYLNGWNITSNQADGYTARSRKASADKLSLEHQRLLFK